MPSRFTSAFVAFELVTEIAQDEDEFRKRRGCLRALLELEMDVEWMLPSDRLKAAFPILGHKPDHIGTFWRVLQCAKDSESIMEFERLLADRQLTDYRERLEREHTDIVVGAMRIRTAPPLRQQADAIIEKHIPQAGKQEKRKLRKRGRDLTTAYRSAIGYPGLVKALAYKAAAECTPHPTEDDVERTAASYNRSIDVFIRALAHALDECQLGGYMASENDFADLLHLIYLRDGDVLISEERDTKLIVYAAGKAAISVRRIATLQGS